MQPAQPTQAQIDLIRNLVRSVTPENSHVEGKAAPPIACAAANGQDLAVVTTKLLSDRATARRPS